MDQSDDTKATGFDREAVLKLVEHRLAAPLAEIAHLIEIEKARREAATATLH